MIRARVITCSDGVARGTRQDRSGHAVRDLLDRSGCKVDRIVVVPDDVDEIAAPEALRAWLVAHGLEAGAGGGAGERPAVERRAPARPVGATLGPWRQRATRF